MSDCVFCAIVSGDVPAEIVWQSDDVTAFRDLNPQAPVHVLVVPNAHVASVVDLPAQEAAGLGDAVLAGCVAVASQEGVADGGFRVVTNVGADGGQSVGHLHFHVLGGRALAWPPG